MRLFYQYLKRFLSEDFHPGYYLATLLFIVSCITINYMIDFEDGVIDRLPTTFSRLMGFMGLYIFAYAVVLILNKGFHPKNDYLRNRTIWLRVIFGTFLLSIDSSLHLSPYLTGHIPIQIQFYTVKVLNNLMPFVTYVLPLWLLYKILDNKGGGSFNGITRKGFTLQPYIQLFAIVIPLVLLASFHENFNSYYPNYKSSGAANYWDIPEWLTVLGYELAYGSSFFTVELLFRGFFVIGMIQLLGRHAILPMVAVYCFIHFGKPLGECVSSIFGGFLLGVIAYHSRNIWGGVLIHTGLAWLMEIAAYLQQRI